MKSFLEDMSIAVRSYPVVGLLIPSYVVWPTLTVGFFDCAPLTHVVAAAVTPTKKLVNFISPTRQSVSCGEDLGAKSQILPADCPGRWDSLNYIHCT